MLLGELLTKEQIVDDLSAANRWEAIDELIDRLVNCRKIRDKDRKAIAAAVRKREESMSTGIGFGVGLPHASTDLVEKAVGAFGRSKKGILRRLGQQTSQPRYVVSRAARAFSKAFAHAGQRRQIPARRQISKRLAGSPLRRGDGANSPGTLKRMRAFLRKKDDCNEEKNKLFPPPRAVHRCF